MDAPSSSRRVISLRGASLKEDSRAVLLEKAAEERALRALNKKKALAALNIQRIWRGRKAIRIAVDQVTLTWDTLLQNVQTSRCIPDAQSISNDILRPFIFFMRHLTCYNTRQIHANDLHRVYICFQVILQSISCPDQRNFCTLAVGHPEREARWHYQVHKLFNICSAIVIKSKMVPTSMLGLAVRLMVTMTDQNTFKGVTKQEAEAVTARLLWWLVQGNSGFYYAAHGYLVADKQVEDAKESFLVAASVITISLRPLHNSPAAKDREKAAEGICEYILSVPCLMERLPAALTPAFQHPHVLGPCLKSCKDNDASFYKQTVADYAKVPPQAWILANIVTLTSTDPSKFLKGIVHEDYVDGLSCLLQSLMPWVETVRERRKQEADEEADVPTGTLDNQGAFTDCLRLLKPLHQQWHVVQLTATTPGTEAQLALTKTARLYSFLLTAYSALNSQGGALPVLNVLAFTKQQLPQMWNWLRHTLKVPDPATLKSTENVTGTFSKPAAEDENRTTSKWDRFLKMKPKNASPEAVSESPASSSRDTSAAHIWHIKEMKRGPGGLPEEAVPVFTLFCTVYSHLLFVLDDEQFYEKQVPFSLDEQRLLCAMLNTMVYHGFFLGAKQRFSALMEASCRCLRALYERNSRRSFCPTELWLAPAMEMRPAIAAAARAHEVASVPKVGDSSQAPAMGSVLTTIPHVLPFEERVQIFREFIRADKVVRKMGGEIVAGSIDISVRRDRIVEDGLVQLNALGSKLKSCINVSFVNDYGLGEAGLDYGGLFKEFLTNLAKAAFDPGYGLFLQTATEERFLFPHPGASSLAQGLKTMEFLGRIVGKALYEGILLEHSFSPVFITKLLGRHNSIDDLASLDAELHRNLMYLKNYEGDLADMALDFTVTEEMFGKLSTIELVSDGANISVTTANKLQYVHAMADYKLNRQASPVVKAFIRGLTDLIAPSWLSLFNGCEFNQLLSGEEHDFDVHDLRTNTRYTGGYTENSRTVKLFWEVLEGLDVKDRCALLKFVTSCSRAPLLGFKHLQPAFTIHKVACDTPVWTLIAGHDVDRLPSASTCYNILKLPTYRRLSTLREKLQYAIRSNAGFELS